MKQTAEYIQAVAEVVSSVAMEISAGLLERPLPPFETGASALAGLCTELQTLLDDAVPDIQEAFEELALYELEDIDDIVFAISEPTLDFVDMARKIWKTPLPPSEEKARIYLAAIAEFPAVSVLAFCQRIMQAALDPWAVSENPDDPNIAFTVELDCKDEKTQFAALLKRDADLQHIKPII